MGKTQLMMNLNKSGIFLFTNTNVFIILFTITLNLILGLVWKYNITANNKAIIARA